MVGGHVHVAHMSAWTTLEAVRQGKSRGVKVTCEVAPHHFTLTDALLAAPVPYDTDTKMNPPLREQRDLDAMLAGREVVDILGAVSMDVTTIDISSVPHLQLGDEVTLLGAGLDAQAMARAAGTIAYAVLCGINSRVSRVFV